jgi:(2Fe-2S) ferredoxin
MDETTHSNSAADSGLHQASANLAANGSRSSARAWGELIVQSNHTFLGGASHPEELVKEGVRKVEIRHTGCMGLCHSEPTVEIAVPGMPAVVYGKVDANTARKIVHQHIVRKLLVNDHIFDKPAADIVHN